MARRSPESMLKHAREQALREKRESKQAKKDARAEARRAEESAGDVEVEGETRTSELPPGDA